MLHARREKINNLQRKILFAQKLADRLLRMIIIVARW